MTGEEGDIETKIIFRGNVRDLYQILQRFFRNRVWLGLKVIPQQKYADDIHADLADDAEFFAHFTSVEVRSTNTWLSGGASS